MSSFIRMMHAWFGVWPWLFCYGQLHTDNCAHHYGDVIRGAIASQITSFIIVYSTIYSDADQRKHQSSASLAFVWGTHRGPANSPHKWSVTRKVFPVDDVIMQFWVCGIVVACHWLILSLSSRNTSYTAGQSYRYLWTCGSTMMGRGE